MKCEMDSNLQIKNNTGCKELLLKKLSYAVTASLVSQIIILSVFVFIVNVNILHPFEWIGQTFSKLTSITTWLFIVPFLSLTFAQSIICAKDYVLKSTCSTNRLEKFLSAISFRNILLFVLHIFSGGLVTWLYLSLIEGKYSSLFVTCKNDHYCLNKECFYLITCGLWCGFYFFVRIYVPQKRILFPVVYQSKLLQFKSRFILLIKESQKVAFWPTIYFIFIYLLWNGIIQNYINSVFSLHKEDSDFSFTVILVSWFFNTLYIFSMNIMRFFFELFLTEPVDFPILSFTKDDLSLSCALSINNIPIIQHLACFDLFITSRKNVEKRKILYTLSQPGNHPHNWNNLVTNVLKIISENIEILNVSSNTILNPEVNKKVEISSIPIQSPLPRGYSYDNMRNLSLQNINVPMDVINVTQNKSLPIFLPFNSFMEKVKEKINSWNAVVKSRIGINYLLGYLPLKNIHCCLENGQIIIWITQGLSNLIVTSLKEDNFGVVQKDLSVILSTLVELKQSVEKLNRIPAFTRKVHNNDDFNIKMKSAIYSAVKRSLYNICKHFGPYLNDVPLKKEVFQALQPYLPEQ